MTEKKSGTRRKTVTIGDVVGALARGELDDQLIDVAKAVQARVAHAGTVTQWRLKLEDLEIAESDLTLDEWDRWSSVNGAGSWQYLKPLQSPKTAISLLTVLYQTRSGLDADAAEEKARAMTAAAVVESFSEEAVPDPLDRPSTASSPPAIS